MDKTTEFALLTDEQGDEYTCLAALVIGNQVEVCPLVRVAETGASVDDRMEALGARFGSHPSDRKYFGIVYLYRTGQARPSLDGSTSSIFEPQGRRLALQAAEDLYDRVWPDVAEWSQQFVRRAVADINSRHSVYYSSRARDAVASGAIEAWMTSTSMGDLLRKLLFEEEKEFLANGAITQKIGFVKEYGAPMMAVAVPYEKYRWGRAVAEIARTVNARKLIRITDGFLKDPETEETGGQKCLWGLVIGPDGSIEVSARGVYAKDNGRLRVTQGTHLFVFRSRRGDRLKILVWDRDGFVLWYKRLEVGVFKIPRVEQGARSVELRASELAMILDGIDVSKLKRVPRYERAV